MEKAKEQLPENDARQVVLDFIKALNNENFEVARHCLAADMVFKGVMGTREGADVYIKDMEKMKLKYGIKKVFADENEVCLFYDITMSGKNIFSCGWYHVAAGKIKSFEVIFDPRPLLEEGKK